MGGSHSHSVPAADISGDARYREIRWVTLVGSFIDLTLGVAKLVFGYMFHSQALVADGVHSLSDLATDFMVLFAAKHGSRDADESHPYGHGRIETIATVVLGIALVMVAGGIAWDAVERMFHPDELLQPGIWALVIAGLSVVSKEWIYHYTMRVAKKLRSDMLKANAWHSRSDAISSVVVMIGVGGTMAGLPYLDAVAAVVVAIMVAKIGWDLSWNSIHELADASLEAERVEAIRRLISHCDGVVELHMLRTRRMGGEALADVHIQVKPKLSVSEAHFISETVRQKVIREIDEVSDVLIHIDPENDEQMIPSMGLPGRRDVLAQIIPIWQRGGVDHLIEDITLHYLDGKLLVDLFLPMDQANDETIDRLKAPEREIETIRRVNVYFH